MRLLAATLAPFSATRQLILLFDAVPLHLADEVFDELRLRSIWFLVIPARVTWLLQPLDTHAFATHKRYLNMSFQHTIVAGDGTPLRLSLIHI